MMTLTLPLILNINSEVELGTGHVCHSNTVTGHLGKSCKIPILCYVQRSNIHEIPWPYPSVSRDR